MSNKLTVFKQWCWMFYSRDRGGTSGTMWNYWGSPNYQYACNRTSPFLYNWWERRDLWKKSSLMLIVKRDMKGDDWAKVTILQVLEMLPLKVLDCVKAPSIFKDPLQWSLVPSQPLDWHSNLSKNITWWIIVIALFFFPVTWFILF